MAKINKEMGMVQFENSKGDTITTSTVGLSLVRTKDDRNLVFYGSGGKATLKDVEFTDIHDLMGLSINLVGSVSVPDDDDLTTSI